MNKKKIFNDQVVIDSVKINKNKELKGNKLHWAISYRTHFFWVKLRNWILKSTKAKNLEALVLFIFSLFLSSYSYQLIHEKLWRRLLQYFQKKSNQLCLLFFLYIKLSPTLWNFQPLLVENWKNQVEIGRFFSL